MDAGLEGYNLFLYCANDPVGRIDISGADSEKNADIDQDDDDPHELGAGGAGHSSVPSSPILTTDSQTVASGYIASSENGGMQGSNSTALQPYYPPNNGFSSQPQETTLSSGTEIQRTGNYTGRYVAPAGTPSDMLSLPYNQIGQPTTMLIVAKPITVMAGPVAPWFGQIGGGTQYILLEGNVQDLLNTGCLVLK